MKREHDAMRKRRLANCWRAGYDGLRFLVGAWGKAGLAEGKVGQQLASAMLAPVRRLKPRKQR